MPAERMPHQDRSLLALPLEFATRLIVRFPLAMLVAGVALAVISAAWTAGHLGFRTSRLDLLNPNSGFNKLWIDYIEEFGDEDDAVVVVEGTSRDDVVPVLQELSQVLARENHLFHAVLHEVDLTRIRAKGLHYLSVDELSDLERFLGKVEPIVRGDWSLLNVGKMTAGLNYRLDILAHAGPQAPPEARAEAQAEVARMSDSLLAALEQRGRYQSPWHEMDDRVATLSEVGTEYLLTNDGRLGFVMLRLAASANSFSQGDEAIDELRRLIAQVNAHHPQIKIGLTGLPVMENDEMRASQSDTLLSTVVSLFGVACLFIAGFGGIRHPLMSVATLMLAMAWSLGYITVAVGHLNILSVSFGVILIGLGIDFGIHFVARYLQVRRTLRRSDEALVATAGSVGPGIITGAVTTAIAFFCAALTEFTGIAELGIIAGGGILLCVTAALWILPAAIQWWDHSHPSAPLPEPLSVDTWVAPLMKFPRLTCLAMLALTAALAVGSFHVRYDHNLLNLQPRGLESVELEHKLLTETDQSVWFALSMAETREELLARKARFLELDIVDRTEEIVSLLPAGHEEKRPIITRVAGLLTALPERPPLIPVAPPDLLGGELAALQDALLGTDPRTRATRRQLEQIRDLLRRMPPAECYARLSDYQQRMAGDLLSRLHALRSMADPEPPQLTDLPESLVTRFVGKSNRHLLKIYSRGNIWDMEALDRFVHAVKEIDPHATGKPLQTYYASRQMLQSYIHAALYALVAVTIVLMFDFRSPRYALLAMLPLGLGMVQLFGLLGLLDIPLNPANMIVLPLILGIGIDDGVHVVHDYLQQPGRYRLSASTATAVLITSLTTMVGFGSLMLARHQGLVSLGRVLTIGVSCCLVTSLLLLPALLVWMSRHRPEAAAEEHRDESAGSRPTTSRGHSATPQPDEAPVHRPDAISHASTPRRASRSDSRG